MNRTAVFRAIVKEIADDEPRGVVSEGWCGTDVTPGDPATYGCTYCGAAEEPGGRIVHVPAYVLDHDGRIEIIGCLWLAAKESLR